MQNGAKSASSWTICSLLEHCGRLLFCIKYLAQPANGRSPAPLRPSLVPPVLPVEEPAGARVSHPAPFFSVCPNLKNRRKTNHFLHLGWSQEAQIKFPWAFLIHRPWLLQNGPLGSPSCLLTPHGDTRQGCPGWSSVALRARLGSSQKTRKKRKLLTPGSRSHRGCFHSHGYFNS